VTDLIFTTQTGPTLKGGTERMRINKDGLVGIGTAAPASLLHLNATAVAGTRETLMRASVSDGGNSLFEISNATATDNRFLPTFMGYIDSTNASSSLTFRGLVSAANDASDSATSGIIDFQAFRTASATNPNAGSFADCTNRKLFTFSKQSAVLATITAAGNFGVGVTPAAKIHALSTTEQLRLGYDISNFLSTTVSSTGSTTFALTGTTPTFTFSQGVTFSDGITIADAKNIILNTTTGTKIGTAVGQKLAFWNATPVSQQAHIADASGGVIVDTEARAAIASINALLATLGLTASS
jgi:hypothetical protein